MKDVLTFKTKTVSAKHKFLYTIHKMYPDCCLKARHICFITVLACAQWLPKYALCIFVTLNEFVVKINQNRQKVQYAY